MCAVSGVVLVATWLVAPASANAESGPVNAEVTVVQAVPGASVDVLVDGRLVRRGASVGSVVGPISLSPGTHDLSFTGVPGSRTITTQLTLARASARDVVLHRPASIGGSVVLNSYAHPDSPIGPGKGRVLLAHTATVAPADATVDGKVVFENIANGEFAEADVPAGAHRVALVPTGTRGNPFLGPIDLDVPARTATLIYAVGSPRDGSMNVITHAFDLSPDGSMIPRSIDTGSAGLAAHSVVRSFSVSVSPVGTALHPVRDRHPASEEFLKRTFELLVGMGPEPDRTAEWVPPRGLDATTQRR